MPRNTGVTREADGRVLVFTDESNRSWEVHEIRDPVLPDRRNRFLRSEFSAGWLLFVSGDERRRFAPYPVGWRFADAARLRCWVNDALPVRASPPDRGLMDGDKGSAAAPCRGAQPDDRADAPRSSIRATV